MKNLSTQELLEILRQLDHRGVEREEVLKALCSDVEKHKEIGEFLVLRRQEGLPPLSRRGLVYCAGSTSFDVLAIEQDGTRFITFSDDSDGKPGWNRVDLENPITHWYDFGSEE